MTNVISTAFRAAAVALGAALALTSAAPAQETAPATCPSPELAAHLEGPLADVRYLADDALEGREVGSVGARCAGDFLAARLEALGLEGAGPDGSFFQTFQVRVGTAAEEGNGLVIGGHRLGMGRGWMPLGFSSSGEVRAPMVYFEGVPAGPALGSVEMAGKILVVDLPEPSPHGSGVDPHFGTAAAAARDAAGILFLYRPGGSLPDLARETRAALAIPAAAAIRTDELVTAARAGAEASLAVRVAPRLAEARNVVAVLPGADPALAHEVVVVGAHYDHLGLGGEGSLSPDDHGTVHNGADDNASGTAALLEVARLLTRSESRPDRTVLFLAFTGEEKGLWGSAQYVNDPLVPLERTVAMLNMDMVGRVTENRLTVFGVGTATEWPMVLDAANKGISGPFEIKTVDDGFGPSDHSSFYGKRIPVLHFFSNTHEDYHRITDDWDRINGEGVGRVAELVAGVVGALEPPEHRVALTVVEQERDPHAGMATDPTTGTEGSTQGFRVSLGTIPDYSESGNGLRITGVRKGSAAEKAGLQGGDVIVGFGEAEVTDVYTYMYALQQHAPGDEVDIVVMREGKRLTFRAVLEGSR